MKELIEERIEILEEIIKEDKGKLSSDSHVVCFNRWIGELRAYKSVLKLIKEKEGEE